MKRNNQMKEIGRGLGRGRAHVLCFALCGLLFSGCIAVNKGDIAVSKATVFGLDISYDSVSTSPHVRLGLVRYYFQRVPTSTNRIFAPDYVSCMTAEITPLRQSAAENFATGWAATNAALAFPGGQVGTNELRSVLETLKAK